MPLYECTFIARQDVAPSDVNKLMDSYTSVLSEHGGKVVKREYWGLRPLAYRIQKNRKGHYAFLGVDAPANAVKEMERQMGINEDIIRNLTVRVEAMPEGPSAILQQSNSTGSYSAGEDDRTVEEAGA